MERAENMARILGVTSNLLLLDTGELQEQNLLAPLSITETEEAYKERHDKLTLPALIEALMLTQGVDAGGHVTFSLSVLPVAIACATAAAISFWLIVRPDRHRLA